MKKTKELGRVFMAQLAERSDQTQNDPGSNPTINNFYEEELFIKRTKV